MKRFRRFLALCPLLLLACTDSTPTAITTDDSAVASEYEEPCPACAFGPRRFRQQDDRSQVTFVPASGLAGSCMLGVRDDGRPATQARIWLNGMVVVEPGALLGPAAVVRVPVTVAGDSNTIAVAVRGGTGHFVTVRIVCDEPAPTARMVIVSGDSQVAAPNAAVPIPPAVLVTRADGSPWAGVVVTFAVSGGGGAVTGATPTTGMDGIATVGSWILGATPGSNALTATAADSGIQGSPVTFTAAGLGPHPMAAGGFHACGVASGGATYCWGLNNWGQLGDGTYLARHEPTPVLGAPPFVTLTAGLYFTCGLTADGTAYCWGNTGATTYFGPGQVGGALRFTSLSASHSFSTCGLATDGTAYCWGENYWGQLGDGTTNRRTEPTPVTGGLTFTTLVAGYSHSCGLTQAGELYCWGSNEWGQLGDSTMTDRLVPTPVATTLRFAKLTLGKLHTCALTPLGEAYCWGTGEMGDGTSGTRPAPVKVLGGLTFTTLTTGAIHTCGLTTAGAAYCWGQGTKGQLGLGTLPNWVYVPKPVAGGLTFHDIVGGWEFTSAITTDGVAYAWGENSDGQLGDGTTSNRISPTPVIGGLQFLGGAP